MNSNKAKLHMVISTATFGTVGIFRRFIPLPSSMIAMTRGLIGGIFLLIFILSTKKSFDKEGIKKNGLKLVITGVIMSFNWILLFESYNYTSVARATLYYYIAPVFLIIMGAVILKEKLTKIKVICSIAAVLGISLVSGVFDGTESNGFEPMGLLFGLGAAVLYATVMFMNKITAGTRAYDKTMLQLLSAGTAMIFYSFFTGAFNGIEIGPLGIVLALILGIFHTGYCYSLFFGAMDHLSAQSIALMTYIDPVVAVFLSAILLKEHLSIYGIIGAIIVIVSMAISEIKG